MDAINFTPSEMLFVTASLFHWDNGTNLLHEILHDKHCDKATALLIYWNPEPGFYYGYDLESEFPDYSIPGYKLNKKGNK